LPYSQIWLAEHPVIRVSPDLHYEPLEFVQDGKHRGLSGDYFDLLSQMLGVKFELVQKLNWSESVSALESKEVDVLPEVQVTEERRQKYNFTKPYIDLNTIIITNRFDSNDKLSIKDFENKKIGIVKGYFWEELVRKDFPKVEIVLVSDEADGLQKTALGSIDGFLGSLATTTYYINKEQITNLMLAGKAPYQINYSIAIRKDWPELAAILDKAISAIPNETKIALRKKWIKLDYETPFLSKRVIFWLLTLLSLSLLAGMVLFIGTHILRKKVDSKTQELQYLNTNLESIIQTRTEALQNTNDELNNSKKLLTKTNTILQKEKFLLEKSNKDLEEFSYVASHDLKSPLNGIKQLASWIEEDCQDLLPDNSKVHLSLLKQRTERMLKLLNDLLNYARIGNAEHSIEKFSLKNNLNDTFKILDQSNKFELLVPDAEVSLPRIPFELVTRNLLSNAIKHHDLERGIITVSYEYFQKSLMHEFKIADNGPGIDLKMHHKVLQMFQTLQPRDKVEGSGMGLAMVSKIMEFYNGEIIIESDPEIARGTTMVIRWPALNLES